MANPTMSKRSSLRRSIGKILGAAKRESGTGEGDADRFIENQDGTQIFWQRWLPEAAEEVRGVLVISHGVGEHCGRYAPLAKRLTSLGLAVYALDHQGHGKSGGRKLHVHRFSDFCADVRQLAEMAKQLHPEVNKCFLLAHSMGSLIAIQTVLTYPTLFCGVVLSAPPLKLAVPPGGSAGLHLASALFPRAHGPAVGTATLCRDPQIVEAYMADPLVNKSHPTVRLADELLRASKAAGAAAEHFPIPYLLMHGTGDKICLPTGSLRFHEATRVEEEDKTFVTFPGAFHELFNEPDNEECALKYTMQWLEDRLGR